MRDGRDSTLLAVIPLTLTAPMAYEANPGIIRGLAPPGATSLRVLADGRSVRLLRLTSGRRAFLLGPIGCRQRLTLTVQALRTRVVVLKVEHVPAARSLGYGRAAAQIDGAAASSRPAGTHGVSSAAGR
jgi:hypothetical protein